MKQPDDSSIGRARKTLPNRRSRKVQKSGTPPALRRTARKKKVIDKNVEEELVKVFGQK